MLKCSSTLEPDFVKALGPEIVICSCSRTSYQKNRVATFGQRPKCLYTPRDGCITLRLSSDGRITTATFLNGQSL